MAAPSNLQEVLGEKRYQLAKAAGKDDLSRLWVGFHDLSNCISATIPSDTYNNLLARTKSNPTFLLPLPKATESTIEFIFFQQLSQNLMIFIRLDEYQSLGANAPCCLVVNLYTDFLSTHELVLLRGEPLQNKLTTQEASILISLLQIYYLSDEHFKNVKIFNETPAQFDYSCLLKGLQIK